MGSRHVCSPFWIDCALPVHEIGGTLLHLEHASVGRKADAPQRGQVMQQTSDLEVVAVVDCGFRAQARTAPARLMILLEVRVLVIDVQRRDDSLGNNARPASAVGRSLSLHPACKDQLHRFRSAQIDVLPDDLLKELPSMARAIPHLGQRKLRLQYREPVTVTGFAVFWRKGIGQRFEPLAEKSLDLLFIETFRQALCCPRVRATQKPVVERFELDAAPGQLPLEILVPVDAELAGVGKIRAELDEEWPEVSVHAVEVVVIDHGTGVVDPRNGAPALSEAFADGARDGCLFLRDADEDDTLGGLELPQAFLHHVVFTHPFLETDNLNVLALGKVEHLPAKPLAQCHGVFGRGEPVALVAAEIGSHTARAGQLGDIKVQIHPVDAFQLQGFWF